MNTLNQGRSIYYFNEAIKLLDNFNHKIVSNEQFKIIIKSELYYVIKSCKGDKEQLLNKLFSKLENIFIKTNEVRDIINYYDYYHRTNNSISHKYPHKWFLKNIELGYVPTPNILKDILNTADISLRLKLYELYPTKINPSLLFDNYFLYLEIFNTFDIDEIKKNFNKYKILDVNIEDIINNCAFSFTKEDNINTINKNMLYLINYIQNTNRKLKFSNILSIIKQNVNCISFLYNTYDKDKDKDKKNIVDNFKNIIPKLSREDLLSILIEIVHKKLYNKEYLNFLVDFFEYEKLNEENIDNLIKNDILSNLPFDMLKKFYSGKINTELIQKLIFKGNYNYINQFIKYIETNNTDFIIDVTLDNIFKISFENCSIGLIENFLNNKFSVTEEMILNNFSPDLYNTLVFISKKGIYITEKCFDHIIFNIIINKLSYNHKDIQNVSIYVNDDDEFQKFIPEIKKKYDYYNNLKLNLSGNYRSILSVIKDQKITKEMIILSESSNMRAYLFSKLNQEQQQQPKKITKKIIVKKIVKKSKDNNIQNE
jgi:hypothetical protein